MNLLIRYFSQSPKINLWLYLTGLLRGHSHINFSHALCRSDTQFLTCPPAFLSVNTPKSMKNRYFIRIPMKAILTHLLWSFTSVWIDDNRFFSLCRARLQFLCKKNSKNRKIGKLVCILIYKKTAQCPIREADICSNFKE